MKSILTPDEMRAIDCAATTKYGIAPELLMENAARSACEILRQILKKYTFFKPSILFLCGSGNNGGDGFAMARMLHQEFCVKIYWIGSTEKMSAETLANFKSILHSNIHCEKISEKNVKELSFKSDVIVDCLLGTGGTDKLRALVIPVLKEVQAEKALKIAIDVPTGIHAKTGAIHERVFKADHTITMFAAKTGMYLQDAPEYCGEIHIATIGAPAELLGESNVRMLEKTDIRQILLKRKRTSSKFDYGRIAVIAGSLSMPGAATLTANAAITAGAGLVELFTTSLHPGLMPEIMPHIVKSADDGSIDPGEFLRIFQQVEKADVLAIGPGFGNNDESQEALKEFLAQILQDYPQKKVVIDADGLRIIGKFHLNKNVIITPHTGEFARLLKMMPDDIFEHAFDLVQSFAQKFKCTVLLKGATTIISDGRESFFNTSGNPGMATAGSGDVLTGIIAALCGQHVEPLQAAALGAYLHGLAGDYYADNFSQETLTATKIIENLENVLKDV